MLVSCQRAVLGWQGWNRNPDLWKSLTEWELKSLRFHHPLSSVLMFLNVELGILALGSVPYVHFWGPIIHSIHSHLGLPGKPGSVSPHILMLQRYCFNHLSFPNPNLQSLKDQLKAYLPPNSSTNFTLSNLDLLPTPTALRVGMAMLYMVNVTSIIVRSNSPMRL